MIRLFSKNYPMPAKSKSAAKPAASNKAPLKTKAKIAKKASKVPDKKSVPSKSASKATQKAPARKTALTASSKASAPKKAVAGKSPAGKSKSPAGKSKSPVSKPLPVKLTPFLVRQRQRLLALKDTLLDSMNGVARDSLRSRAEGSEASAFGMHQADAGSDAYDRDFALSLLSQEQDSLYEIDEALKRIEQGNYGNCEMSGKPIPHPRLEALPFTRYTVECQTELEKRNRFQRVRQPVTSLFGLNDEDSDDSDDDSSDSKD